MSSDHGESGQSAPPEVSALAGEADSFDTGLRDTGLRDTGLRAETSPVRVAPQPGVGKKISAAIALLGAGLLWPVPLAGALLLAVAAFGLAIVSEAELIHTTAATTNAAFAPQVNIGTAPSST